MGQLPFLLSMKRCGWELSATFLSFSRASTTVEEVSYPSDPGQDNIDKIFEDELHDMVEYIVMMVLTCLV
jgi:hypothetical protein